MIVVFNYLLNPSLLQFYFSMTERSVLLTHLKCCVTFLPNDLIFLQVKFHSFVWDFFIIFLLYLPIPSFIWKKGWTIPKRKSWKSKDIQYNGQKINFQIQNFIVINNQVCDKNIQKAQTYTVRFRKLVHVTQYTCSLSRDMISQKKILSLASF